MSADVCITHLVCISPQHLHLHLVSTGEHTSGTAEIPLNKQSVSAIRCYDDAEIRNMNSEGGEQRRQRFHECRGRGDDGDGIPEAVG